VPFSYASSYVKGGNDILYTSGLRMFTVVGIAYNRATICGSLVAKTKTNTTDSLQNIK